MTPEEKHTLNIIHRELIGSEFNGDADCGLVKRVRNIEQAQVIIERRTRRIYTLAIGIAIGIGIGAIIFGVMSIKDLIKLLK